MNKRKDTKEVLCFAKCKIEPGMFKNEWLVSLEAMNPREFGRKIRVQLFADEREVREVSGNPKRNQPVAGLLRVSFVKRIGDFTQVVLPQPAQPIGENVCVHNDDLVQMARTA